MIGVIGQAYDRDAASHVCLIFSSLSDDNEPMVTVEVVEDTLRLSSALCLYQAQQEVRRLGKRGLVVHNPNDYLVDLVCYQLGKMRRTMSLRSVYRKIDLLLAIVPIYFQPSSPGLWQDIADELADKNLRSYHALRNA